MSSAWIEGNDSFNKRQRDGFGLWFRKIILMFQLGAVLPLVGLDLGMAAASLERRYAPWVSFY